MSDVLGPKTVPPQGVLNAAWIQSLIVLSNVANEWGNITCDFYWKDFKRKNREPMEPERVFWSVYFVRNKKNRYESESLHSNKRSPLAILMRDMTYIFRGWASSCPIYQLCFYPNLRLTGRGAILHGEFVSSFLIKHGFVFESRGGSFLLKHIQSQPPAEYELPLECLSRYNTA